MKINNMKQRLQALTPNIALRTSDPTEVCERLYSGARDKRAAFLLLSPKQRDSIQRAYKDLMDSLPEHGPGLFKLDGTFPLHGGAQNVTGKYLRNLDYDPSVHVNSEIPQDKIEALAETFTSAISGAFPRDWSFALIPTPVAYFHRHPELEGFAAYPVSEPNNPTRLPGLFKDRAAPVGTVTFGQSSLWHRGPNSFRPVFVAVLDHPPHMQPDPS